MQSQLSTLCTARDGLSSHMIITILFYIYLSLTCQSYKNTCSLCIKKGLCCVNQSINQSEIVCAILKTSLMPPSGSFCYRLLNIISKILKVHDYYFYASFWMFPAVLFMSVFISMCNIDAAGDIMILLLIIIKYVFIKYKLHWEITHEPVSCSSGHNLFNAQTAQFIWSMMPWAERANANLSQWQAWLRHRWRMKFC